MMLDELARYNKERWEALAQADIAFSRPFLDLIPSSARQLIDPHKLIGPVDGKSILCLAGGGQQSAAFSLLGAQVTVLDLSETQLAQRSTSVKLSLPCRARRTQRTTRALGTLRL